jgi:hypothetical protein
MYSYHCASECLQLLKCEQAKLRACVGHKASLAYGATDCLGPGSHQLCYWPGEVSAGGTRRKLKPPPATGQSLCTFHLKTKRDSVPEASVRYRLPVTSNIMSPGQGHTETKGN